ncbi:MULTISPECIES: FAD-dependent oxidoreductase [unclassified Agrococcus]|uniref:FAD-dependent oxidoreductase n=1 Tax=unclassified Agrococcus TaxID=2615065 RepID=UPI00361411AF
MTSLWLASHPPIDTDAFDDAPVDVAVVGAGLAGLATAVLLAERGMRVAVLEARTVGAVATGNTSGKLSALQGARLQRIRSVAGERPLQAYVDATLEAQRWLVDAVGEASEREDAWSYAVTSSGARTIDQEVRVARAAGLPVGRDVPELPFATTAAARLRDQHLLDPVGALAALAARLRAAGGRIHEHAPVRRTRVRGDHVDVDSTAGTLRASRVVLATGSPVPSRTLSVLLEAQRSYAISYRIPGVVPRGMHLSVDEPSRSLRSAAPLADELVVGGAGHPVGRAKDERSSVDELEAWTQRHWPGAERTHAWSAQDYRTPDLLPWCGARMGSGGRVLVATGFDKWGMTSAVACALAIDGWLSDAPRPWAATLFRRRPTLALAGNLLGSVAAVAAADSRSWMAAVRDVGAATPPEGEGVVHLRGATPVATSTVDGVTRTVSAFCPHVLALVQWNGQERSWDCSAHGSRFAPDGSRLEGPSACPLRALR